MGHAERIKIRNKDTGQTGTVLYNDPELKSFIPDRTPTEKFKKRFSDVVGGATDKAKGIAKQTFADTARYGPSLAPGAALARSIPGAAYPAVGQVIGGLATSGIVPPWGSVLGSVAGAVAGEGARTGMEIEGKRPNMFSPLPPNEAVDSRQVGSRLLNTAAATAVPEILFAGAGKAIKPLVGKFGKRILHSFSGIPEEDIATALSKGPNKVITGANQSLEGGMDLAKQFLNSSDEALSSVRKQWMDVMGPLRADPSNLVDLSPVVQEIGLIQKELGTPALSRVQTIKDLYKPLRGVMNEISSKFKGGRASFDWAVRARQEIDAVLETATQAGGLKGQRRALLERIRKSLDDQIKMYPGVSQVDADYSTLNSAIKYFKNLDPEDTSDIGKLGRLIDKFNSNPNPAIQKIIRDADAIVQKQTGKSMLEDITTRSAAMAFKPSEIKTFRSALAGALLGTGGFSVGGPAGTALGALVGATTSTPAGLGGMLKAGETAGRFLGPATRAVAGQASRMFAPKPKKK